MSEFQVSFGGKNLFIFVEYSKCPKIFVHKILYKPIYAKSADPDQTAPEGAVWSGSTLFAIQLSSLKNNIKRKS